MKPNGRIKTVKFHGKEDCHPDRFHLNWWEDEMNTIVKRGSLKHIERKEIEQELLNIEENEYLDECEEIFGSDWKFEYNSKLWKSTVDKYINKKEK